MEGRILVDTSQRYGSCSAIWNGTDNNGNIILSRIYFYDLKSGDSLTNKKTAFNTAMFCS
ncbi:MAG: hypothetical protein CO189_03380 [candidate division Zixibacteria bacterium CG_4_9_14_3_um_filter_46_8]|nr:MAG: hypothetical protein CO189_03380 [candidate division Zixibacteria bacterium CG_4_9_14_3_um_filter_46_8]